MDKTALKNMSDSSKFLASNKNFKFNVTGLNSGVMSMLPTPNFVKDKNLEPTKNKNNERKEMEIDQNFQKNNQIRTFVVILLTCQMQKVNQGRENEIKMMKK